MCRQCTDHPCGLRPGASPGRAGSSPEFSGRSGARSCSRACSDSRTRGDARAGACTEEDRAQEGASRPGQQLWFRHERQRDAGAAADTHDGVQ